jgi:hypothetical protein
LCVHYCRFVEWRTIVQPLWYDAVAPSAAAPATAAAAPTAAPATAILAITAAPDTNTTATSNSGNSDDSEAVNPLLAVPENAPSVEWITALWAQLGLQNMYTLTQTSDLAQWPLLPLTTGELASCSLINQLCWLSPGMLKLQSSYTLAYCTMYCLYSHYARPCPCSVV